MAIVVIEAAIGYLLGLSSDRFDKIVSLRCFYQMDAGVCEVVGDECRQCRVEYDLSLIHI